VFQHSRSSSTAAVRPARGLLAEMVEVLVLALAIYLVISFAVQTVHVVGSSMFPTLVNSDYLIASKLDYRFHNPSRGDIIIMRDPYDQSKDFIKRVVGMPGERILIRSGQVYINGRLLEEPYLKSTERWTVNANLNDPGGDPQGLLIPKGYYFVMGDNRNYSSDSRFFGPVRRDQIEARALFRVLPLNQFGAVGGASPHLAAGSVLAGHG